MKDIIVPKWIANQPQYLDLPVTKIARIKILNILGYSVISPKPINESIKQEVKTIFEKITWEVNKLTEILESAKNIDQLSNIQSTTLKWIAWNIESLDKNMSDNVKEYLHDENFKEFMVNYYRYNRSKPMKAELSKLAYEYINNNSKMNSRVTLQDIWTIDIFFTPRDRCSGCHNDERGHSCICGTPYKDFTYLKERIDNDELFNIAMKQKRKLIQWVKEYLSSLQTNQLKEFFEDTN